MWLAPQQKEWHNAPKPATLLLQERYCCKQYLSFLSYVHRAHNPLLGDDAAEPAGELYINGWIARIRRHWAHQEEQDILEIVRTKLDNGEAISPEERERYYAVLLKTKRKAEVEES